jgi:hypothetical protein
MLVLQYLMPKQHNTTAVVRVAEAILEMEIAD